MGIEHLVQTGPLILAAPVAAAAGALTFLSPCVLPLVPGYLVLRDWHVRDRRGAGRGNHGRAGGGGARRDPPGG